MRPIRFALPLAALMALSGCDWFGEAEQEAAGNASGDVLPGSVSDEMIPVQDLRSQPPVLAPAPGEGGSAGVAGADSAVAEPDADGEAPPAADAAPAEPEAD